MESSIKPFSVVIEEVDKRVEHIRSLGSDAPIREYGEVYCSNLVTDPAELQLLADTIREESSEISIIARSRNIDTHFDDKFNYLSFKRVSGWIVGTEVLSQPELGDRNGISAFGSFLSIDGGLFNLQDKTMGKNNIPSGSVAYNSKLYTDKDVAKIFKHAGLKEIKLENLKDSRGLAVVREHLAEFVLKNSLQNLISIN